MDKIEVIILTAVLIYAGIRIYQKYFRKESISKKEAEKRESDSVSSSSGDDYEPYSGSK
ncbi:MAG: hypothetical protein HZB98_12025 [Bacteroidia bacterium]|nr:hypothetical protein [Bacteroidia bacterium]